MSTRCCNCGEERYDFAHVCDDCRVSFDRLQVEIEQLRESLECELCEIGNETARVCVSCYNKLYAKNERLKRELEQSEAMRKCYRGLPEEYHKGMLELLVKAAFEAVAISHGRAAELLGCSYQEIREKGWIQGKKDEEIARLQEENARLREWWLAEQKARLDQFDFNKSYDASKKEHEIRQLRAMLAEGCSTCKDRAEYARRIVIQEDPRRRSWE